VRLGGTRRLRSALAGLLRLQGIRGRRLERGPLRIRYWEGGSGSPLIFLHGLGASALWQWHPQLRHFARNHRVLAPDLLFFGDSVGESTSPDLDQQVDAILEWMDACGIPCADWVGLSYGGFVAARLAERAPERVRGLVLVASPIQCMRDADVEGMRQRLQVKALRDVFLPAEPAGVRRLIDLAWTRPPWVPECALEDAWRTLFQDHVHEKEHLLTDLLGRVGEPMNLPGQILSRTALVWGEEDVVFPRELAQRCQKALGDVPLHWMKASAHAPQLERPMEFNRLVERSLKT